MLEVPRLFEPCMTNGQDFVRTLYLTVERRVVHDPKTHKNLDLRAPIVTAGVKRRGLSVT